MPSSNRNTLAVPASPWGLAWLLNNTGSQGNADLNLPWFNTTDYATLNALVAAAGAGPYIINVTANVAVTANLTLGAGIHLVFQPNYQITVNNTFTLTVNSPEHIHASPRQDIFTLAGTGVVGFTNPGTVYPGWWGAVADGVTDDTAAVQAAVSALLAVAGGVVRLPAGTYRVTTTIDATGAAYVSFVGDHMLESEILYDSAVDLPVLSLGSPWTGTESRGWNGVRDLTIRGDTDAVNHGTAIYWQSANPKAVIERVNIRGMKYGLHTTSDWGCHYRDLYINYATTGIYLSRQPNGVTVENCYCQRCETGIAADSGYDLAIRNCIIERATTTAISLVGGGPIVIDGCYFEAPLAGDTTITVTRKGAYSVSTLTVSNCHVNDDLSYFIRGHGIDELRCIGNTIMTPAENHVLVLSDTQILSNGIKHAVIEGNTIQDFTGSGYNTALLKYLCRELGGSNPVRWDIGENYEYTLRGTVYYGTLNALPLAVVSNMWKEHIPHAAWDPDVLTGFAQDADSDNGTASPHTLDAGHAMLKLVHGGAGGWAWYRYTRSIDLATLRAVFAATGNLRLRLRCWAKNALIQCRGALTSVSATARSGSYELLDLYVTVDVNGAALRLGYGVATGQTGYVGPLDITIMGTEEERNYLPRAWPEWPATIATGIVAVNPGVQGDGPLTARVNVIATCGVANDAVTMPEAIAGREIILVNNGAQTLEIWPAAGDDLGAGVNTAVTLAAGSNRRYVAIDATNWEVV